VEANRNARAVEVLERIKSVFLLLNGTIVGAFDVPDAVGLTFDDGPHPDVTPAILEVLARHGARATFFVLTDHALARRDLMKRIQAEGHEIALHFDRHDHIPSLPPLVALRRMIEARRLLAGLSGRVRLFRPPYGSQNYLTYLFARMLGLKVIGWTRWANDWLEQTAESAAQTALEHLRGGDIVLMHDGLELGPEDPRPTFDRAWMVELFLREAKRRGLAVVGVGSLIVRGPRRRSHWFR
jgi:peptidoglycan/xylan/chitin deacetylase (PgdA/CDA1 family)